MDNQREESNSPAVTCIIPCFNQRDWIKRSLDSVADQDYPNLKIVIIDPGSDDMVCNYLVQTIFEDKFEIIPPSHYVGKIKAKEVITKLYHDKHVVVIRAPNTPPGPSAARNCAIRFAWDVTDLFVMLDADDYFLPGKVSKCVAPFLKYPEHVGLVYNDMIIEDSRTGVQFLELREPYDRNRLEKNCIICNNSMISKEALEASGLYDENMRTAEDWHLYLRVTANFAAVHIPEPLAVYNVTDFNADKTVDPKIWQENWQKIRGLVEYQQHAQSH